MRRVKHPEGAFLDYGYGPKGLGTYVIEHCSSCNTYHIIHFQRDASMSQHISQEGDKNDKA